jgi:hypothetical protein
MMKKLAVLSGLIVLLACAYKPQVQLTAQVPPDIISNAVTAALHPTFITIDTVFVQDSLSQARIDSLQACLNAQKRHQEARSRIIDVLWVGLHVVTCLAVMLK